MSLKKRRGTDSKLYCIIDRSAKNPEKSATTLFARGADIIQLRYKNLPSFEFVKMAKKIARAARKNKKVFLVNDRVDVALASASSGVHIGAGDLPVGIARSLLPPKSIIGKTVHSLKQAKDAKKEKIDYVSAGPVFFTPVKKELGRRGVGFIKKIKKTVSAPVYAIGGINDRNMMKVLKAGADGICVTRAASQASRMLRKLRADA